MKKVFISMLLCIIFVLFFCLSASAHGYSQEEIVLVATITQAEAGNQDELGKRLVADTIFNRVEADTFPDTVSDVILQRGQFTKRRLAPPPDLILIVQQESVSRTNDQVLWFRTNKYSSYGSQLFKHGAHFFSGGGG